MLQGAWNREMISQLIDENEFRRRLAFWLFENGSKAASYSSTKSEYAERFVLPEFAFTHTQSYPDENGDLITMLKSEVVAGKSGKKFEFYKILKTLSDTPDVEPFPMGYIIVL